MQITSKHLDQRFFNVKSIIYAFMFSIEKRRYSNCINIHFDRWGNITYQTQINKVPMPSFMLSSNVHFKLKEPLLNKQLVQYKQNPQKVNIQTCL